MKGINSVTLLGRMGKDPEAISGQYGSLCKISICTGGKHKTREGREVDTTTWHDVSVFGKTADFLTSFAKKGDIIYVDAYIKKSKYIDKTSGAERQSINFIATQAQIISSKSQRQDGNSINQNQVDVADLDAAYSHINRTNHSGNDIDDDLPF